ncbi:MAG: GNAT family N-acetyltransferase [Steroidobacteraceae bacterium]
MRLKVLDSITEVDASAWNALDLGGRPFLRHEFLLAAEASGSAVANTGWRPRHLVLEESGSLVGAMPLYEKDHSWGEFVFDFAWARAYAEHGLPYYPKLVAATPFTPATGPRLLVKSGAPAARISELLLEGADSLRRELGASSVHCLFVEPGQRAWLEERGFLPRLDCQFHWHNRGYGEFEDFLAEFSAEKRKKARRERRRVTEQGIQMVELHGGDLDRSMLETVYALHASTFLARGNPPYFTLDFFRRLARDLPEQLMIKLAMHHGEAVAVAIFLRGEDTLYGRYWGSTGLYHSLHFETCYHQGVEYCIREGLSRFEPGTQGEHKIARGFRPTPVWSAHRLAHPAFAEAVAAYLARERQHIEAYLQAAEDHVPFRRDLESSVLSVDGSALHPR